MAARSSAASEFGDSVLTGDNDIDDDAPEDQGAAEGAQQVGEQYVMGLTFVCVRKCRCCGRKSSLINPLTMGHFQRGFNNPTWPWLKGASLSPSGRMCRLCPMAMKFGGFLAENGGAIEKVIDELKKGGTYFQEFEAVLQRMIVMMNKGQITLRCRGSKKDSIEDLLKAERKRIVTSFHRESLDVKSGYRAIKFESWVAKNPKLTPEDDGRIVRTIPWPGTGEADRLYSPTVV